MINTTTQFAQTANGTIRPLAVNAKISFSKQRNQYMGWFILDQSLLDGDDILATNPDDAFQLWDAYDYYDVTSDIIGLNWSRSVAFPYNVQSALCEVQLNNVAQKYTYGNSSSPLYGQILPKRPIIAYSGFRISGSAETVPIFVGLTQKMPKYTGQNDIAVTFSSQDFLSEIANMELNETVMLQNVRTDEAIATILDEFGMDATMYQLEKGINKIPFCVFESGANAGNILQKLVQAENGRMWLDEKGIIRFEPRTADVGKTPVMTFDADNIISVTPSRTDGIVNRVKITSDIRAVQAKQPIFSMANEDGYTRASSEDSYRVKANGNTEIWISFEDPIWDATLNPVLDGSSDDSAFSAVDLSGNAVTSGLTATGTLFSDSMKVTFANSHAYPVSINFMEIWGEPAKVIDTIKYNAYDSDSVDKFGEMVLDISDNNYFGSLNNADDYAEDVLKRRADYSPTITLAVKGNPALQLSDIIYVDYKYHGNYRVVGIKSSVTNSGGYKTELTVEKFELLSAFVLDESILDGTDVLM